MSQATWGEAESSQIDWRMSAALQNVPRGDEELVEVTSLEGAVRAWLALDPAHRDAAILKPERSVLVDGASLSDFFGEHITALADRLPGNEPENSFDEPDLDDAS